MLFNNQKTGQSDDQSHIFITRKKRAKRESRLILLSKLNRAAMLGNASNEPTLFRFTDGNGVPTSKEFIVQSVTSEHVVFRDGKMLHFDRIIHVDI